MGEIVEVDLTQLRAVADRVMDAATQINEMRWPTLDPDELRGSAVSGVAAHVLVAARLDDVVKNMQGWAMAAHMSADAFERADVRNGDRFRGR
jgi:type II secretory pathway component PulM